MRRKIMIRSLLRTAGSSITRPRELRAAFIACPLLAASANWFIEQGFDAKISPDGKTMLFGRGIQLYRRAINGGPSTLVFPRLENSYNSAWSLDGSRGLVTAKNLTDRGSERGDVPLDGGEARHT